ncbi:hypothetical protein F4860DRAFT_462591 [Xylaria cubensis]|nr:hypothetical protein F4860DRAFT_462591 [Xylaria cubensis]
MRPWNAAPDYGGKYMWEPGCTIIDITDHSYAFFLPAHQACGRASKQTYRSLRLRPLNGHEWLTGSGEQPSDSKDNHVWIGGRAKQASVTSMEAVQEVWPSFPPEPPSADSDSEDRDSADDDTEATDNDEAELKDDNAEEEAPVSEAVEALVLKTEGSAELETEQPSVSRKRKREPEPDDRRVWSAIEDLLISCPPTKLGIQKRRKTFRPLLKRFMDIHPEHFADKHPGSVPLLLAAFVYRNKSLRDLDLHRFRALSGNQVVELVKGAVAHNEAVYKTAAKDLEVLDVSFNPMLTPDDIARIVEVTALDELIIWNNPGLSQESVAKIANGRIAKVTTRAGFLAPLKRLALSSWKDKESLAPFDPPPPFVLPTQVMIRQVMWMMLGTIDVDPSGLQPDLAGQLQIPEGRLSLEELDVDTLAVLLHPRCKHYIYSYEDKNKAFAQLVALPCHDAWVPLAELYTSIARFEKFMSDKSLIDRGYENIQGRWPLAFPLMMAMGNEEVSSFLAPASKLLISSLCTLPTSDWLTTRNKNTAQLRCVFPLPNRGF